MDFRDEYKKEITELSSDETTQRIREGVMAKLAQSGLPQSTSPYPETPAKKPLPIKRIAVIGGSIAACLVIGFTVIAVKNTRLGENIFSGMTMAPSANNAEAPNLAGGAALGSSRPDSVIGEDFIGATSGANTEQVAGGYWVDTASDGGLVDNEPTASAPENEQGTSIPAQADSEPRYPDSDSGESRLALITFEGDGFTLDYDGDIRRFVPAENGYDSAPPFPSGAETNERIEAYTPDGELYFITLREDDVLLVSEELKVLGRYVLVG